MRLQPICQRGVTLARSSGIGDRALDVALGEFLHRHKHFGCIGQGETDELLAPVDGASYQSLVAGNVREGKAFCGRVVAVETGEDPRGGALIHVQLPHQFWPVRG